MDWTESSDRTKSAIIFEAAVDLLSEVVADL
jgi:hypothetical protein